MTVITIYAHDNDQLFMYDTEPNSLAITLEAGTREGAHFRNTDLNGADLREADLRDADLRGAHLRGADLKWAHLSGANLSGAYLNGANLRGANLRDADLNGANLSRANLSRADLRGAYLRGANLRGANLREADLNGANLRGADLNNEHPIPIVPNIDAAILAALDTGGQLEMETWHTCKTTHCRAGWAMHLAGNAGAQLEKQYGPGTAGALIYHVSAGYIPDFYASNEDALADIKAHAREQGA
jgi:uncharacterized protein YjbI with pentapeptide repeats